MWAVCAFHIYSLAINTNIGGPGMCVQHRWIQGVSIVLFIFAGYAHAKYGHCPYYCHLSQSMWFTLHSTRLTHNFSLYATLCEKQNITIRNHLHESMADAHGDVVLVKQLATQNNNAMQASSIVFYSISDDDSFDISNKEVVSVKSRRSIDNSWSFGLFWTMLLQSYMHSQRWKGRAARIDCSN